ncbi:MAG: hypothetical protein ACKPJJ_25435 [Planctomycetaceae bacterium]
MSEQHAESDSLPVVPFKMTARHGRLMAAVQAAQVMTVAIPLVGYLARGDSGAGSIVAALLFLIPVLIVQVRAFFVLQQWIAMSIICCLMLSLR